MPLLEHLTELRTRVIRSLIAVGVGCLVSFAFVQDIWDFLVAPMNEALVQTGRGTMAITEPLEGFMTYLKVAALSGFMLASPIVFYQGWRFIAPGLYPKEQKTILPLVFSSTALFLAGSAFCYAVIFRFAFLFFLNVTAEDVEAVLSIAAYLGVVTKLLLAFGVSFQLPVVIYFLARAGLVDHLDLIKFTRYSVVAMFVLAALLTPPDILSQFLMAGPLMVLYGVGIIIARFATTKVREE